MSLLKTRPPWRTIAAMVVEAVVVITVVWIVLAASAH